MRARNAAWALAAAAGLAGGARAEFRHTVVPTDTMWDLAGRYYSDHYKWRRISEANPPPEVHDPHWIYPGQVLVIPDLEAPEPPAAEPPPALARMPASPVRLRPPKPAVLDPSESVGTVTLPESLSTKLPEGLVAQPPSNYRLLALPGWSADGKVVGFDGRETLAAEGDLIDVRLEVPDAEAGQRYLVFRPAAPTEADADKAALYLVKVGLISLKRPVSGKVFRAVILKSSDSLQLGDIVKLEE